jgi:hypothetical protein
MISGQNPRSRTLLPSIPDALFLGILFFLTLSGDQVLLGDADTGYHVRAGEFILDHFRIPQNDIFSYLTPPLPWTLHEWLAETIIAQLHRLAGLSGVVIFFAILIALSSSLTFELLLKLRSNLLFAAAMALLVALCSASNWLARPHIFSFVFLIVWYHLLINYHQIGNRKVLFWLPPLMLLWVNLHGGFILGFILLAIYCFGSLAQAFLVPSDEKKQWLEKSTNLALTMVACVLLALFNPYGFHTLLFPLRVVQDQFLMDHISEYLSPNFHSSAVKPFEILLLTTLGIFGLARAPLNVIELILIVLFGHMALYSSRHIPLFAIIASPIVLTQATLAFERLDGRFVRVMQQRLDNLAQIHQGTVAYVWSVFGVLFVTVLAAMGIIKYSFDPKHIPVRAMEFVQREQIAGNVFNDDEFGDYIIYAAWPKYKVFIDGRTDMYGANRVKEYIKVTQAQPGWENTLEKYQVAWVFQDPSSSLSKILLERSDWKLVYSDGVANIFLKRIPENDLLINKFRAAKPFFKENNYAN